MRYLKYAWVLLAIGIAYYFRQVIGQFMLLVLVSATIAYLINPIAKRLPFKAGLSTGLSFLIVLLFFGAILYFGIPALIRQLVGIKDTLPKIIESFTHITDNIRAQLSTLGVSGEIMANLEQQMMGFAGDAAAAAAKALMNAGNSIASAWYMILSPVVAFYMVRDKEQVFSFLQRLIPNSIRFQTMELGLSIKNEIGAYVRGQLTVSLVTGILTGIGLLLIGVPSWLVLGLLMVLFNLIPYFGPWLAAIPIVIFSIPSGLFTTAMALLIVLIVQQLESIVVAPRIIGQASQLHPAMVMLSLVVGSWVFGFGGLLFSIPAVLTLRATMKTIRDSRMRSLNKKV